MNKLYLDKRVMIPILVAFLIASLTGLAISIIFKLSEMLFTFAYTSSIIGISIILSVRKKE